jgi:hypothetical protein
MLFIAHKRFLQVAPLELKYIGHSISINSSPLQGFLGI